MRLAETVPQRQDEDEHRRADEENTSMPEHGKLCAETSVSTLGVWIRDDSLLRGVKVKLDP
jgi:hypothetical protein